MKGDFSRWNSNGKENFNGVLLQQGRIILDNDWNDQTTTAINWQDRAGRDTIGGGLVAVPSYEPDSLTVLDAIVNSSDRVELAITPGSVWADGILSYLPSEDANSKKSVRRIASYFKPMTRRPLPEEEKIEEGTRDAVILEVWREEINGFQMPDLLIEPALGGIDTTERVHTGMRFRLLRLGAEDTCRNIGSLLQDDFSIKGKLRVSLHPLEVTTGEGPVDKGGGYDSFENRLYRIEIAQVNIPEAMFKWSRFNGGLVGRGNCDLSSKKITITANDQTITNSGSSKFYLEVIEFDAEQGFWRVTYGAEVTLNVNNLELEVGSEHYTEKEKPSGNIFFRLWDGILPVEKFPKVTSSKESKELRDGIRLEFDRDSGTNYQQGDYWTFKVRAGEIVNPAVPIDEEPPEGINYHRVPLAILNWNKGRDIHFDKNEIKDCRRIFRPLTNQTDCRTFRLELLGFKLELSITRA